MFHRARGEILLELDPWRGAYCVTFGDRPGAQSTGPGVEVCPHGEMLIRFERYPVRALDGLAPIMNAWRLDGVAMPRGRAEDHPQEGRYVLEPGMDGRLTAGLHVRSDAGGVEIWFGPRCGPGQGLVPRHAARGSTLWFSDRAFQYERSPGDLGRPTHPLAGIVMRTCPECAEGPWGALIVTWADFK